MDKVYRFDFDPPSGHRLCRGRSERRQRSLKSALAEGAGVSELQLEDIGYSCGDAV